MHASRVRDVELEEAALVGANPVRREGEKG